MWDLAVIYYCCGIMMHNFNLLGLSLFFGDGTACMDAVLTVRAF